MNAQKSTQTGHSSLDKNLKNSYTVSAPTEAKSMKAYSYVRWSSDKQTAGDSLTRQLEATRRICAQNNWQLDESLKPAEGQSAFKGDNLNNGSLAEFVKAVDSGKIKVPCVLIVEQLDRLTRTSLRQARKFFDGLLEKGVKICTANNGRIYDDSSLDNPMDLFFSLMELKAAHEYSANLGRRVGAARQREREAAAKDGKIWTNMAPAWLDVDKEKQTFTPNETATIVKRIFKEYSNGKGLRGIVCGLNEDRIPAARSKIGWSSAHVRRILSSRQVLGEYQPMRHLSKFERVPAGEVITGFYPPIIEPAIFYRVQDRLSKNVCRSGPKKGVTNLFQGVVKCEHCGASMVITSKRGITKLVCSNANRHNGCAYKLITYSHVERAILSVVWETVIPAMGQKDDRAEKLIAAQGELKTTKGKIETLQEIQTETPSKATGKSLADLEAKQDALTQEIEALAATVQDDRLTGWTQVEKNDENRLRLSAILASEIDRIVIDADKKKAVLTMKGNGAAKWQISWGPGRNNPNTGFYFEGEFNPYADNLLVWESPENTNLDYLNAQFERRIKAGEYQIAEYQVAA